MSISQKNDQNNENELVPYSHEWYEKVKFKELFHEQANISLGDEGPIYTWGNPDKVSGDYAPEKIHDEIIANALAAGADEFNIAYSQHITDGWEFEGQEYACWTNGNGSGIHPENIKSFIHHGVPRGTERTDIDIGRYSAGRNTQYSEFAPVAIACSKYHKPGENYMNVTIIILPQIGLKKAICLQGIYFIKMNQFVFSSASNLKTWCLALNKYTPFRDTKILEKLMRQHIPHTGVGTLFFGVQMQNVDPDKLIRYYEHYGLYKSSLPQIRVNSINVVPYSIFDDEKTTLISTKKLKTLQIEDDLCRELYVSNPRRNNTCSPQIFKYEGKTINFSFFIFHYEKYAYNGPSIYCKNILIEENMDVEKMSKIFPRLHECYESKACVWRDGSRMKNYKIIIVIEEDVFLFTQKKDKLNITNHGNAWKYIMNTLVFELMPIMENESKSNLSCKWRDLGIIADQKKKDKKEEENARKAKAKADKAKAKAQTEKRKNKKRKAGASTGEKKTSKRQKETKNNGIIYMIKTPHMPGIVKVGFTSKDKTEADIIIRYKTYWPEVLDKGQPIVIGMWKVDDKRWYEKGVHDMLYNNDRWIGQEYFECKSNDEDNVKSLIHKCIVKFKDARGSV